MRLIVVCAAALGGVAIGDLSRLEPSRLVFGGLLASLGAALAWRWPGWRLLALVTLAAALGAWRASVVPSDDTRALEPYLGLPVRLRGVVVQPPSSGPTAVQLVVDTRGIGPAGRDPSSTSDFGPGSPSAPPAASRPSAVRLRVVGEPSTLQDAVSGETLVLEGRLVASDRPGPPTLLFPRLLGREPPPVFPPIGQLDSARAATRAAIQRYLPEPQASVSAGVLLGGSGQLDADFRLRLQRSGLAHVVAIDGFKQVVVAGLLAGATVRLFGARAAAVPVLLGIAGYTLLTGAHPAAVRAGLMVGLATLASLTGRVADPLTSVLVAVTIMAAFDPRLLLDVGLQLSLSATLGIVLLWPRLRPRLEGLPRGMAEPAGLTLAVTVATLPVTLSAFQSVSLVSPFAHVVAVPLLPVVLLSTGLLALVSPLPGLAAAVAWLGWLPSTLLVAIVEVFGSLPGAALSTGRLPPLAAAGLAAIVLAWGVWALPEASELRQRVRSAWATRQFVSTSAHWPAAAGIPGSCGVGERSEPGEPGQVWMPAACLAACLAAVVLLQVIGPDGRLHVQNLPQARGQAVFIRGPTGRTVLVVAGRLEGGRLATQVGECLAVWEHRLDAVVQLDLDAQPGLGPALSRYPAEQYLDAAADARLALGGGGVLDVYASAGEPSGGVSVSFGHVWLPLVGRPPPPAADASSPSIAGQDGLPTADLVSDGSHVWAADAAAGGAQLALPAQLR